MKMPPKKQRYSARCYGTETERKVARLLLLLCFLLTNMLMMAHEPTEKTVTLKYNNAPLTKVLMKIEDKTGYKMDFTYDEVQTCRITVNVNNATVRDAMNAVLKGTPFSYSISGRFITVYRNKTMQKQARVVPAKMENVITGRVLDENEEPVIGASIYDKDNMRIATITNDKGLFEIRIGTDTHQLTLSYMGMKTVTLKLGGRKTFYEIHLQTDQQQINEVVVTGIYTRKSESFTGSAATYKQEELKEIGNQNVLQSLSAIDPSFVIADNNLMGSNPNEMMDVTINGTTSITGLSDTYSETANQPLFILDGFESSLQTISDLSMDRVESITILKDAASTAIYGAKAANGVIVVETKKPTSGRLRFSYQGNYQLAWADLSDYNLMNAREKLEFERFSGYYGSFDDTGELLNDAQRQIYYSRLASVTAGLDSYWMNEPLRTAFTHEHSLNAEGGDQAFRYGLTFRYKNQEGVMKKSNRQNIDGTINLAYRVDKFNFSNQTNIGYTDIDNNVVPFSSFSRMNPYQMKYDENGNPPKVLAEYFDEDISWTSSQYVYNPLWDFQQKSFDGGNLLSLRNNFIVEYNPMPKLRIQGKFGIIVSRESNETFISPYATEFINTETLKRGTYDKSEARSTSYDGSLLISYGDVIGKHTYNAIAGAQLSDSNDRTESYSAEGYITDLFSNPNFSNGYPDGESPSSSITKYRSASFYFNGNYAYDMRYLMDVNLRTDGSSVYGVNNPFSTTWSFGVGWNLHNEAFFKKSDVINYLKLRYSLGNPGNQNIDAKTANNIYTYYTSYQNIFGLAANIYKWGNKNLKWQRTTTHNVGIDTELFKSRLHLTFDYTLKNSDPILLNITVPASIGATSVPMNIGATKNKTFAMTANYQIIRQRNFTWRMTASLLSTRTKYYKIGDALEKYNEEGRNNQTLLRYYDGASATAIWAVRSMGIDPMTGNEVFMRKDGTYTYKWDSSEEVVVGDTSPDVEGNVGTTVRWHGFSFGMNFRYRCGGQAFLSTLFNKVESLSQTDLQYNQDKRALYDRWQKPGDVAKFKRIDDTSTTNMSSRFVADDNTFECKSVSLGYETTKAAWLKTFGLTSFNFRVYMNDIFRISSIKDERGIDYPFQRALSASLSLRF